MDTNGGYRAGYPSYPENYSAAQGEVNDETYVVQPGDTLSQIAERLGVSVDQLASYNGIADPNVVHSGQPLYFLALENQPVEAGSNPITDGGALHNSLEAGGNVAGLDLAGSVALIPTSENGVPPEVAEGTATSNGAVTGGQRPPMLPATGGGGRR